MANIYGNTVGGSGGGIGKTLKLIDENGVELIGTIVDSIKEFTATVNDVRKGKTFCSDSGSLTGEKDIPAYRTQRGCVAVKAGTPFSIKAEKYDLYDYTQLQCMMAAYDQKYAIEKVVIDEGVYNANSNSKISDVTKDYSNKSIQLNINNDSQVIYFLYYFMYKEEL